MAKAKKQATATAEKAPVAKATGYTVTAHLGEGGQQYAPGDTITLTAKRASALGDLVKPTSD
jgi:hypothetical protein